MATVLDDIEGRTKCDVDRATFGVRPDYTVMPTADYRRLLAIARAVEADMRAADTWVDECVPTSGRARRAARKRIFDVACALADNDLGALDRAIEGGG